MAATSVKGLALVDDFRTFKMEGASLSLNEFIAA